MTLSSKIKILIGFSIFGLLTFLDFFIGIIFILCVIILGINILSHIKKDKKNLEDMYSYLAENNIENYKGDSITNDEIGNVTKKLLELFSKDNNEIVESDNTFDTDIIKINKYIEDLSLGKLGQSLSHDSFDEKLQPMVKSIEELEKQLINIGNNIETTAIKAMMAVDIEDKEKVLKGCFSKANNDLYLIAIDFKNTQEKIKEVVSDIIKGNLSTRVTIEKDDRFNDLKILVNTLADLLQNYIGEISKELKDISEGSLNLLPNEKYVGDFVNLNKSKNIVVSTINTMVKNVNSASDEVLKYDMVSNSINADISNKLYIQGEKSGELINTITSISKKTNVIVNNTNKAKELTASSKNLANDCTDKMAEMLEAMESVEKFSRNISNVIKVIEDIAFQTNILALNAAVEAARAGVHGKGFAVVAEEVRNLSMRSQKAVKESESMISVTVGKVDESLEIAKDASSKLAIMVENVEGSYEIIDSIHNESKEQNILVSMANDSINSLFEELNLIKNSIDIKSGESQNLRELINNIKKSSEKFNLIDEKIITKRIEDDKKEEVVKKEVIKKEPIAKIVNKVNKPINVENKKPIERPAKKREIKSNETLDTSSKEKEIKKSIDVKTLEEPINKVVKENKELVVVSEKVNGVKENRIRPSEKAGVKKKSTIPDDEILHKRVDVESGEPKGLTPDINIKTTKDINLKTDEEIENIISKKDFGKY